VKAKVAWGLLLLALLSACRRPEKATPTPPTVLPPPTPTATEAVPTPSPVVPTATEEVTATPPPVTPTATEVATSTPEFTPTPEGIWPKVVTKLELGVPVGNGYLPRGIAVNAATGRIYVRNERSDSEERGNVSVIDAATHEIIATIPVGQSGWDYNEVAVDEIANRVYVVNRGDKTLTVIDGTTHQVLATIESVEVVAVDPVVDRLYVADGATLRLLDARDYNKLRSASLPPGSSINALTLNSPADRLYLARSSPDALDIFAASTLERVTTVSLRGRVQDLAVNTVTNRLYAALGTEESNEILTLDGTSGDHIASLVVGEKYQESVLAVDEVADRLYVGRATSKEPSVAVVNGAMGQIVDQIGPTTSVEGIALDPHRDRLYLSLTYDNQVAVIDTEQKSTIALVPTAIEVVDAAVNPHLKRLYITDSADQLHIFDSANYEELALVPGRGPLAVDDVRHRIYVGDPDGQGIRIIDGQTNRQVGLVPQTGKPVVDPETNMLYIIEGGVYIADPETQSVVGQIDSTFAMPSGFSPNPYAVDLVIDPQLDLLYVILDNGVPGSNGGSYLQVYDGVTHTSVFTDTELSVVSIDVDPTAGRAYMTRARFNYLSLKVLDKGWRWVARLEGIVGHLRVDPSKGLVYMTSGWDKGSRLLVVDGQTADLLAEVLLSGEYALHALDPLAERLYLIGEGGSVLVMAESGGALPALVEPRSVKLPASPIQRIFVSPDYDRDRTLLVLVENKPYKSEDGGGSWLLMDGGLPSDQDVVSVAFSSNYASDHSLLAGLSTWNIGGGVYRSTDGGQSWRLASRGLRDLQVQGVAFAADGTAFARTTRYGLFKRRPEPVEGSTDGGSRWAAIEEPQIDRPTYRRATALAISPGYAADGTLFWSLDEMDRYVVLKSTDGGQSWEEVLSQTAQLLAMSPDYPRDHTVYAVLSGAGLMRSTDEGKTWQAANSGLFYEYVAFSDLVLSPSFAEDKTLYALFTASRSEGTPRLYRSTDGGDNWKVLEDAIPISTFALLPDGDLLLGTVDGRIHSLSAGGLVWEDLTVGLDGMDIYDLAISPGYAQDQTIYASTSTAGVFISHDGGRSWQETGFPGRAGGSTDYPRLAISPDYVGDQTLFVASGSGVYRWLDGDWQELQEGLGNLFPASALAISPNFSADSTLFIAGDYRCPQVFISTDRGESWTSVSQGLPEDSFEIASLAISPNYAEDGTVYAWLQYQGLYRTTDRGQSWEQVKEEEDWYVQSMALSPDFATDQTLFVGALDGNLHRSDDGGFTWQALGGGLPPGTVWVWALVMSPEFARDGTLFAGLDQGIYKSTDGGHSWQAVNTGLPHRPDGELAAVLALAMSPDYTADQTALTALFEHGVYKSTDGGASWYPPTWGMPFPTPPPSPTPTRPAVTPTPCAVIPVRFATIWADRRDRLGCPAETEREVPLAEEAFERGRMFWRGDSREIYVLHDDHTWRAFADTWQEGQPQDDPNLIAPPGLFQPKRGFGKVWREELGGPASQIGWAREEELGFTGVVQAFDAGTTLWSNLGTTYILYAEGYWEAEASP
jgi:YVTN family beta-propeller protein